MVVQPQQAAQPQQGGVKTATGNKEPIFASGYQRGAVVSVVAVALLFFLAVWALDGYATARMVRGSIGAYLAAWVVWGWPIGIMTHILISLFQQHGWKVRTIFKRMAARYEPLGEFYPYVVACLVALTLLFGVINVLATAVLFIGWFDPATLLGLALCVILAEVVSIIAEPVIVGLFILLWRLRHSK